MVKAFDTLAKLRIAWLTLVSACACAWPTPLAAQVTAAGVVIESAAQATYDEAGTTRTVNSNTVEVRVAELLSLAVASREAGAITTRAGPAVLRFLIENTGNGPEQFILDPVTSVSGNGFDTVLTGVAVDSNGNEAYDAGVDQILPAPATTALIPADAGQTIFVLLEIPAGIADGATSEVRLSARPATGTGAPGTVFAGAGEGGGDAVLGSSGAGAAASSQLIASAGALTLVKWASVADPFGGTAAVPGAVVTYSIQALASGTAGVTGLVVSDAIPLRTTYRANSLQRDGTALTDAPGDDAGEASAAGISVTLGTLAGGASSTVSFAVEINEQEPSL
ncbi:MAG: hypothetical protein MUF47_04670 [Porphyrobacter sp.]|jgi:uncharacterized repeat protein (TIGR01451 family)|nr:hypothetical protein [Porphyrobacter sp.]